MNDELNVSHIGESIGSCGRQGEPWVLLCRASPEGRETPTTSAITPCAASNTRDREFQLRPKATGSEREGPRPHESGTGKFVLERRCQHPDATEIITRELAARELRKILLDQWASPAATVHIDLAAPSFNRQSFCEDPGGAASAVCRPRIKRQRPCRIGCSDRSLPRKERPLTTINTPIETVAQGCHDRCINAVHPNLQGSGRRS